MFGGLIVGREEPAPSAAASPQIMLECHPTRADMSTLKVANPFTLADIGEVPLGDWQQADAWLDTATALATRSRAISPPPSYSCVVYVSEE